MNYRAVVAAVFLIVLAGLALASALRSPPLPAESRKQREESGRTLPGLGPDGAVRLPNQWSLRPAGKQLPRGDFPVNLVLHPGGRWLAALHAGYGTHEVVVVTLGGNAPNIVCRVPVDQAFYGMCF